MGIFTKADGFDVLMQDHKKVLDLAKRIKQTGDDALKTREKLKEKLHDALELHMAIEEKYVYPLSMEVDTLIDLTREAYEEHNVLEMLFKKLLKVPESDENWMAKFTVITENLQHHINEEEEKLFPDMRKSLSDEQLKAMKKNILQSKQSAHKMTARHKSDKRKPLR